MSVLLNSSLDLKRVTPESGLYNPDCGLMNPDPGLNNADPGLVDYIEGLPFHSAFCVLITSATVGYELLTAILSTLVRFLEPTADLSLIFLRCYFDI
jgi:hypothetical protein